MQTKMSLGELLFCVAATWTSIVCIVACAGVVALVKIAKGG